jgi:hypothetical protein
VDVVEWSRALNVRLSEWCCIVSMVWVQIPSREEQNLTALKSNSNTVWFNFQTYIYIYIYTLCYITALHFLMYDKSTCAVYFSGEIIQKCCADYEEIEDRCIGEYYIPV